MEANRYSTPAEANHYINCLFLGLFGANQDPDDNDENDNNNNDNDNNKN